MFIRQIENTVITKKHFSEYSQMCQIKRIDEIKIMKLKKNTNWH